MKPQMHRGCYRHADDIDIDALIWTNCAPTMLAFVNVSHRSLSVNAAAINASNVGIDPFAVAILQVTDITAHNPG